MNNERDAEIIIFPGMLLFSIGLVLFFSPRTPIKQSAIPDTAARLGHGDLLLDLRARIETLEKKQTQLISALRGAVGRRKPGTDAELEIDAEPAAPEIEWRDSWAPPPPRPAAPPADYPVAAAAPPPPLARAPAETLFPPGARDAWGVEPTGAAAPAAAPVMDEMPPGIDAKIDLLAGLPSPPAPPPGYAPARRPPPPPSAPRDWSSLEGIWGSPGVQWLGFGLLLGAALLLTRSFYHRVPDEIKALLIFIAGAAFIFVGERVRRRWPNKAHLYATGLGLAMGGFAILYAAANRLHFGLALTGYEATAAVTALVAVANGLYGLRLHSRLAQAQALVAAHMLLWLTAASTDWFAEQPPFALALALFTAATVALALAGHHRSVAQGALLLAYFTALMLPLIEPALRGWPSLIAFGGGTVLAFAFPRLPEEPWRMAHERHFSEVTLVLALPATAWAGPPAAVLVALTGLWLWYRAPSAAFLPLTALLLTGHAVAAPEAALPLALLLVAMATAQTLLHHRPLAERGWTWGTTAGAVAVLALLGLPADPEPLGPWLPLAALLAAAWLLRARLGAEELLLPIALTPWVMVVALADSWQPWLFAGYTAALLVVCLWHRQRAPREQAWLLSLGLTVSYAAALLVGRMGHITPLEAWGWLAALLAVVIVFSRNPVSLAFAGFAAVLLWFPGSADAGYPLLALTLAGAVVATLKPWHRGGRELKLEEFTPGQVKVAAGGYTLLWPHLAVFMLAARGDFAVSAYEPWLLLAALYGLIRFRWREPHHMPLALLGPWLLLVLQTPETGTHYAFLLIAGGEAVALLWAQRRAQQPETPAAVVGLAVPLLALVVVAHLDGFAFLPDVEPWFPLAALYLLARSWPTLFPRLGGIAVTPTLLTTLTTLALALMMDSDAGLLLALAALAGLLLDALRLGATTPVHEGVAIATLWSFTLLWGPTAHSDSAVLIGYDLAALAVALAVAWQVLAHRTGRGHGETRLATPLVALLPLALLMHGVLGLTPLLLPALLWMAALRLRDPLTTPLAWLLLALNAGGRLMLAFDRPETHAWGVVLVLGLVHLLLFTELHLRRPAPLLTRSATLTGFGLAAAGIVGAWGSGGVTTVAFAGLGALVVVLRFRAGLDYLGLCGLAGFALAVAKLMLLDLWDFSTEVKVFALLCLGAVALFAHYLYNRFKERREGREVQPPPYPPRWGPS